MESNSDCFHHACTCGALAAGPDAAEFMDLEVQLTEECGDPFMLAYCGETVPVCESGLCTVARHQEKPELPPLDPALPEVLTVRPFEIDPAAGFGPPTI